MAGLSVGRSETAEIFGDGRNGIGIGGKRDVRVDWPFGHYLSRSAEIRFR